MRDMAATMAVKMTTEQHMPVFCVCARSARQSHGHVCVRVSAGVFARDCQDSVPRRHWQ